MVSVGVGMRLRINEGSQRTIHTLSQSRLKKLSNMSVKQLVKVLVHSTIAATAVFFLPALA